MVGACHDVSSFDNNSHEWTGTVVIRRQKDMVILNQGIPLPVPLLVEEFYVQYGYSAVIISRYGSKLESQEEPGKPNDSRRMETRPS
jgi:cephalosporin hydroxylase